jgi:hypothetical protein
MESQQRLREVLALQLGDQILRIAELTVQLETVTAERDALKQQLAELQKGDG